MSDDWRDVLATHQRLLVLRFVSILDAWLSDPS